MKAPIVIPARFVFPGMFVTEMVSASRSCMNLQSFGSLSMSIGVAGSSIRSYIRSVL